MATRPGANGRAATSGTRKGNGQEHGPGLYGKARGATERGERNADFDAATQPSQAPNVLRAERAEFLKDHLFALATGAENELTQLRASEAWLDRHEGKPIQRVINATVDDITKLDDVAIADEIARLTRERGAGTEVAARAASSGVPAKLGGILH